MKTIRKFFSAVSEWVKEIISSDKDSLEGKDQDKPK